MIEARLCPRVESPCATPPTFARGQKTAFCAGCQKNVYNLSAYSAPEQASLLGREVQLCVRYRHVLTVAAVLSLGSASLSAGDLTTEANVELETITVGGGSAGVLDPVMLDSEGDEQLDESNVVPPQ